MSVRIKLLTAVLCCCVSGVASAEPTAEEWARVLNLSGRQRMLTQKMCKEALFITAGVNSDQLRSALGETTALFETTLTGLRDGDAAQGLPATTNQRIVKQLDKVNSMYLELKPLLDSVAQGGTLSADELSQLAEKNLPLLKEMNKAVKMYERSAKKLISSDAASAVVINLAGKQRMLTQKMTKELLLIHLGVAKEDNLTNLRETTTLFTQTLDGLLDGNGDLELPGTQDAGIRDQLGKVGSLWSQLRPTFDRVLDGRAADAGELATLAKDNVTLLKEMNKGVKLFENAAN